MVRDFVTLKPHDINLKLTLENSGRSVDFVTFNLLNFHTRGVKVESATLLLRENNIACNCCKTVVSTTLDQCKISRFGY